MAYYIEDKQIVENVDINYILDYFKSKGETCVRILLGRSFANGVEKIEDSIIIEPLEDKYKYVYQDGSRSVSIDRKSGSICVNPYFDKTGIYDSEYSLSKNLQEYILNYKQVLRENKIKNITDEI
jgi:hypothetical protein